MPVPLVLPIPARTISRPPGNQRPGVEAEIGGLPFPDAAQFAPVDVAFLPPCHQRRALREAGVVPRRAEPAFGHRRLDLGAPRRERLDRVARDAGDLEAAVGMGLLDVVAEPGQRGGQLAPVERAEQHLRSVELFVGHAAPLVVLAPDHVGDHGMGVELRIEIARGVVAEGGGDDLLISRPHHLPRHGILHPGLGDVFFDPRERRLHCPVMRLDDAGVAADQGRERHRLRRGEGEIAAGTVEDFPVLAPAPELGARTVRHLAFEDLPEDFRIDRPLEPEVLRALAEPAAGGAVLGIVLRVVAVALVVARALRGRGEGADREHVSPSRPVRRWPQRKRREVRPAFRPDRLLPEVPGSLAGSPTDPASAGDTRAWRPGSGRRQGRQRGPGCPPIPERSPVHPPPSPGRAHPARQVYPATDRPPPPLHRGPGLPERAASAPLSGSSAPGGATVLPGHESRSAAAGRATYFNRIEATGRGPGNLR